MANPSDVLATTICARSREPGPAGHVGPRSDHRRDPLVAVTATRRSTRRSGSPSRTVPRRTCGSRPSPRPSVDEAPIVRFVDLLIAKAVQERASDIHIEPLERRAARALPRRRRALESMRAAATAAGRRSSAASRSWPSSTSPSAAARRTAASSVASAARHVDLRVVDPADGLRREGRAADPRQPATAARSTSSACPRSSWRASSGLITHAVAASILVTGPDGLGQDDDALRGAAARSTARRATSSPSRTRSSTELDGHQPDAGEPPSPASPSPAALRSILRQDPDVILVGEIRDKETAEIAVEAALTGHLVLSTLHTNDAASTPIRLVDMGIEPFLVTSALRCRRRAAPRAPPVRALPRAVERPGRSGDRHGCAPPARRGGHRPCRCGSPPAARPVGAPVPRPSRHPRGDDHDAQLAELVIGRAHRDEVAEVALAQGMTTLRHDGLRKVLAGATSLEELLARRQLMADS